jgi:small subunit ribosomal protein S6
MRLYELVLVLRSSLKDEERKKLVESIKDSLKDFKIVKDEDWGLKPLSYKIKRELSGHFHLMHLEGEKGIAGDFETALRRNDKIIRHLLVRRK